jgi:hypothetical protein
MKRIITVTVVVLVTTLVATAVSRSAAAASTSETLTFSLVGETIFLSGPDGCTGENILVTSGTLEIRTSLTTTSSGKFITTFKSLYKNVFGIGTTTGTVYRIQDVLISTTTGSTAGGHWETTLANTGLRVVGPGPDNNRWATLVMHVTGDTATGTNVVEFQHFDLACR